MSLGRASWKGPRTRRDQGRGHAPQFHLLVVIRQDLWSWDRLVEIWRFNTGQYDHLIDADRYRYPGAVVVPVSKVSTPRLEKSPWDLAENTRFANSGALVEIGYVTHAGRLQVSLDHNDGYELVFRCRGSAVARERVGPRPHGGMAVYDLRVPVEATDEGYDSIRIVPITGDERYCLGHLRLRDE